MKCIEYLLFIFNLIFAFTGLALIITGSIIQVVNLRYLDFLGNEFLNIPVLLIVIGCVIFGVAFFGCCGAIKENFCMITTFAVLLSFIFLVEIGAGIAAYMLRDRVHVVVSTNMEKGLQNYGKEGYEGITKTWDLVQHELNCCGALEYRQYATTEFSKANNNSVPDSCCITDVLGCGCKILKKTNETEINQIIHTGGCLGKFEQFVMKNVAIVGSIGVGIAFIQVIGVLLASLLAKAIRTEYESV